MGKVGALIIGAKGAVSTTFLAACCAQRQGLKFNCPLPSQEDETFAGLELVELADLELGGWDISAATYEEACREHGVVPEPILSQIGASLNGLEVFPGIVRKPGGSAWEQAEVVMGQIEAFRKRHGLERVVVVDLSSTERFVPLGPMHEDLEAFEAALRRDEEDITPAMVYAYAALRCACPVVCFTPSQTVDIPALLQLANEKRIAFAGKDGKTGQTLYKTALAPMLQARALKLAGWYSINMLGNKDGEVLHDPEHCATKVASKLSVLPQILGYDDFEHQVHIHYYPLRGDAKEAWDAIDFRGWFDVPMQMRIHWLGWDSILAAPLVGDLIRWVDFFSVHGEYGPLTQLASFFKQPIGTDENHFFRQVEMLRQHVREHYKS